MYSMNYVYSCHGHMVDATGGSHLSRIFWEHENLSGLRVIWLIQSYFHWFIWKIYLGKKSGLTRNESSLTDVWLKWDPPVVTSYVVHICTNIPINAPEGNGIVIMWNVSGRFVSGTYMAIRSKVEVGVCCVLIHICYNVGCICTYSMKVVWTKLQYVNHILAKCKYHVL